MIYVSLGGSSWNKLIDEVRTGNKGGEMKRSKLLK